MHEVVGTMFEAIGEAKIGDDNIALTVKKKVFKLEISMNDFLLMDVPDTREQLGE